MSACIPQPGPEILSLVQACNDHLTNANADELARAFAPPGPG